MIAKRKPKVGRPRTTQGFPRVTLRLPPDLHRELAICANQNVSSINTEVIRRLRDSFKGY